MNPRTPPTRQMRPAVQVHQEPERHTAEIACFIAAGLGLLTVITDGVLFIVLIVATFVAVAVAALALAGELRVRLRERRAWCRGEIITDGDGQAMSASADIGVIAAGHTPSHHGRSRVGAGVR